MLTQEMISSFWVAQVPLNLTVNVHRHCCSAPVPDLHGCESAGRPGCHAFPLLSEALEDPAWIGEALLEAVHWSSLYSLAG